MKFQYGDFVLYSGEIYKVGAVWDAPRGLSHVIMDRASWDAHDRLLLGPSILVMERVLRKHQIPWFGRVPRHSGGRGMGSHMRAYCRTHRPAMYLNSEAAKGAGLTP